MAIDELEELVNKELSRDMREREAYPELKDSDPFWNGEIIEGKMHENKDISLPCLTFKL
jgi:hypothetical protein